MVFKILMPHIEVLGFDFHILTPDPANVDPMRVSVIGQIIEFLSVTGRPELNFWLLTLALIQTWPLRALWE